MRVNGVRNLIFIFCILTSLQGFSQQREIIGTVKGDNGIPIPGANVEIKETNEGTVTDFNGKFSISVPDKDDAVLVFSYLGYKPQEIPIESKSTINVNLKESAQSMDEVIVVGYGTQEKENLTGAIGQVGYEDMSMSTLPSATSALQGKIPGLNIQVNNGDPSAEPDINIRGFNSINGGAPLVLVDGIEGDIDKVNPQDIESVTVLKDAASAAIYGSRGAFGVILITTKKGKSGDMVVEYNNNFSWTTTTTRTDFISDPYKYGKTVDAALYGYNSSNYTGYNDMDWETIRMVADGEIEPFYQEQSNGRYKMFFNTNWYDYLFREYQPAQNHNISISGGSEKLKGYLSGRIYERQMINNIQDSNLDKYNIKSTVTYNPTDWLELSNNILFNRKKSKEYGGYRNGYGGVWSTTTWYNLFPFYPNFIDGVPADLGRGGNGGQGGGPAMEEGNNWKEFNNEQLTNTFRAKITPIENLEINFDYSKRITNIARTYRYSKFDYIANDKLEKQTGGINRLGEFRWRNYYNAMNIFATYKLNLNNAHHFKLMGGYNQEDFDRDRVFAQQGGLLLRDKPNLAFGTEMLNADGSTRTWAIRGYFGRFNYDYKKKYLLEVNARYDGSSRFPVNNRWGVFPSVSIGWQMNREDFWKPIDHIVNSLKVRASYGELGNQNVGVGTFQKLMGMGQSSWLDGGERLNYVSAPDPLPAKIGWEKTKSLDFGADFGFLDDKLELTFDWYFKQVEDMYLAGSPLPAVFGASEPKENHAGLRNTGFELSLGYANSFDVAGSPLSFKASANISNFIGKITKYDNPNGVMSDYWEGQRLGEIWGYHVDGQFQSDEDAKAYQESFSNPRQDLDEVYHYILSTAKNSDWNKLRGGDIKYVDSNGDGKIDQGDYTLNDHGDLQPIGNAMPQLPFGFRFSADWKGIDLSVDGIGVMKQNWYPTGDIFWGTYQRPYISFLRKDLVDNAWTPENPGKYPQIERGYSALQNNRSLYEMNDYYLQNIGFLRVKNLTIGYTLPQELTSKFKIRKLRVYFSGENILTWRFGNLSRYIDPEQAGSGVDYSNPGNAVGRADLRSYPMGKTYSFGVNLTL